MTGDEQSGEEEELETARLDVWREAVDTSMSKLWGTVFSFLSAWIIIWFLPQSGVGEFFFLLAFVYLFIQIPSGVGSAVKKRVSERNGGRAVYGVGGFVFSMVAFVILGCLFVGGIHIAGEFSPISISLTEQVAVLFVAFTVGLSKIGKSYVAGCGNPGVAEKVRTYIGKIVMIGLTAGFLYVEPSVEMALAARGLSYLIAFGVLVYVAPDKGVVWPSRDVFEELWVFCKWSVPTSFLNDFYYRWDTLLLGFMVGAISISYYDSTVRVVTFGTTIAMGVSAAATVKLSGLHTSGEPVLPLAKDTVGVSSLVTFLVVVIAIFNAEFILTGLFGPEYAAAKWFFILMGVTQLFHGWRMQFESVFKGVDYPKGTTWISLVAVIVNIATAPVLVWWAGGIGVVLSTIIAECVRFALYQRSLYNLLEGLILSRLLGAQFVGVGLATVVVWFVKMVFGLSGAWLLGVTIVLGGFVFYGTVYALSPRLGEIASMYLDERRSFRERIWGRGG